jgi:hypothetical protein
MRWDAPVFVVQRRSLLECASMPNRCSCNASALAVESEGPRRLLVWTTRSSLDAARETIRIWQSDRAAPRRMASGY